MMILVKQNVLINTENISMVQLKEVNKKLLNAIVNICDKKS